MKVNSPENIKHENHEDERGEDWEEYMEKLEEDKDLEKEVERFMEECGWTYWSSEQNRVEDPQGYKRFIESHR